jgi:hypothetical protein
VRTNVSLGGALLKQGKFAESLEPLRRAQQLAVEQHSFFRPYAEHNLRLAERLLKVDQRLAAGKAEPAGAGESLMFAEVCFWKKRYADAVDFYRRAFEGNPKLAADLDREHHTGHRSGAARAAALAADGRGEGADALDGPRRADLRKQALSWLRQDLGAWGQFAADPNARTELEAALRLWQRHPHLASVRDPAALARLPAEERQAWEQFWADGAVLLGRVQGSR